MTMTRREIIDQRKIELELEDKNKIFEAKVLHEGWEMDNAAWVEKDENEVLRAYTTTHGPGNKYEMEADELLDKIEETESSLTGLKEIKKLMKW